MSKKVFFVLLTVLLGVLAALADVLVLPPRAQVLPPPTLLPTQTEQPGVQYRTVDPNNPDLAAVQQQMAKIVVTTTFQKLDVDGVSYHVLTKTVISKGPQTQQVYSYEGGDWLVDTVLVYERSPFAVLEYPLAIGVMDQSNHVYYPFYDRFNYFDYQAVYRGETDFTQQRKLYLAYLQEQGLLERGRFLYPGFSSGPQDGYLIDPFKGIEWDNPGLDGLLGFQGSAPRLLGLWMEDQYHMDSSVISDTVSDNRVPVDWILMWPWDAATEENTDPTFLKIQLP
jgi:hypothetical protein